jgi:dCTP deaminase
VPIHLKRGQSIFLIWYASLDCETSFKKDGTLHKGIDPELVTAIAGELQSFAGLSKKVKDVDKALGDRIHAVEREQTYCRVIGAIALAFMIAITVNWLKDAMSPKLVQSAPAAVSTAPRLP